MILDFISQPENLTCNEDHTKFDVATDIEQLGISDPGLEEALKWLATEEA